MKLAVFASLLVIIPFQAMAGSCIGRSVTVWVTNGNRLTGDGLDEPDPYVKVTIGSDIKKTRVMHSTSNPGWWQQLKFLDVSSELMRVEIWEEDGGLRGGDDHLGTCMVPLTSAGRSYQVVECKAKDSGSVNVLYKCN